MQILGSDQWSAIEPTRVARPPGRLVRRPRPDPLRGLRSRARGAGRDGGGDPRRPRLRRGRDGAAPGPPRPAGPRRPPARGGLRRGSRSLPLPALRSLRAGARGAQRGRGRDHADRQPIGMIAAPRRERRGGAHPGRDAGGARALRPRRARLLRAARHGDPHPRPHRGTARGGGRARPGPDPVGPRPGPDRPGQPEHRRRRPELRPGRVPAACRR